MIVELPFIDMLKNWIHKIRTYIMDKVSIANHNVGTRVKELWVVCKNETKDVVGVLDDGQVAKQVCDMMKLVPCTCYKVPSFSKLLDVIASE